PVHDASPIPPGPHPDLLTGPIPPGPLHPDLSLPRSPPATIPEPGPSAHAVCPHPFGGTRPPLFSSSGSVGSFAGPLQFFPCPATSPEGLHCPRGSFVHAPYCRFHLREIKGLDVAPSSIPEAGRGLFTLSARARGDDLGEYMGELLPAEEIERRYPRGDVGIYCLGLSKSLFIDSALIRGACASANASRKGLKPNVRFVPNFVGRSARLEVTRPIPKGGEIFVGYGAEYWRGISSMSYSTVDIPDWEWDTSNPFAPASSTISPALSLPFPVITTPASISVPVPVTPPVVPSIVPAIAPGTATTPPSVPAARHIPDIPPPPTCCEVHVGPPAPRCQECVPGMFVCRSHLVECGGEGLIACSFCLRVCCVVHLYCPCDRAAARRSYVIINDAMMAAARASEWARKAKMAADRAGTAARSMELAGFGGLVFGLGPFMAPTNSRVGVPVLGLSGPTVAPRHNNNLILSGP